ncbi:hypothetical protein PZE06_27005, partial [Robertmurraya sp. DFI.2.37]|uniref:hypothetical protein n=1 Tax=Robertmurraya sp. DFI.2.37 TaxID=3031819 RepID=UPI0023DBF4BE
MNNFIVIEILIGEGNRPLANRGKVDTEPRERKEITNMHERKLLDKILDKDNLEQAIKQVKRN